MPDPIFIRRYLGRLNDPCASCCARFSKNNRIAQVHAACGLIFESCARKVWMNSQISSKTMGQTITIDTSQPDLDPTPPVASL